MKETIKKRWIAALLSGKYVQASGALKTRKGFCCLGVLCDLYAKQEKLKWVRGAILKEQMTLPRAVQEWAEVANENPKVIYQGERLELAQMNDDKRINFEGIAQAIEESL